MRAFIPLAALVSILFGCVDAPNMPTNSAPLEQRDLSHFVTSDVLQHIRAANVAEFASPWLTEDAVTPGRARELAVAFARQFGPYVRGSLEDFHGSAIDFSALTAATSVSFVHSAYEPLPKDAFGPLRKAAGPYYLVTLEHGSTPVLVVAVSALANDVSIDGNRLIPAKVYGNEFRMGAVASNGRGLPVTIEKAVMIVGEATNARVSAIPTFHSRGVEWSPRTGYWRLQLDRPVQLADGNTKVSGAVAYVDGEGTLTLHPPPVNAAIFASPDLRAHGMPQREYRLLPAQ